MADSFSKTRAHICGPGGIRCSCCGGNRKDRVRKTRAARARMNAQDIRRTFQEN